MWVSGSSFLQRVNRRAAKISGLATGGSPCLYSLKLWFRWTLVTPSLERSVTGPGLCCHSKQHSVLVRASLQKWRLTTSEPREGECCDFWKHPGRQLMIYPEYQQYELYLAEVLPGIGGSVGQMARKWQRLLRLMLVDDVQKAFDDFEACFVTARGAHLFYNSGRASFPSQ